MYEANLLYIQEKADLTKELVCSKTEIHEPLWSIVYGIERPNFQNDDKKIRESLFKKVFS